MHQSRSWSNETVEVDQLWVDPAAVRIWSGNPRKYENLTEDNTIDLIESIRGDGQKMPAVVRRLSGEADQQYELIVGARRHFAVSWLRMHERPDLKLLVQVETLNDVAAFRLADLENRARKDVSDMDRARNYVFARDAFYGGNASRLADDLGISKSWLSRMIAAAALPDEVVQAFAPGELTLKSAYQLARALADDPGKNESVRRAAKLASESQDRFRASGERPMSSQAVMKFLMGIAEPKPIIPQPPKSVWRSGANKEMLVIQAKDHGGMTIRVARDSGADAEEIVAAFRNALRYLD